MISLGTPYQVIYDKFLKKLKGDNKFFQYGNLSETEIKEMVEEHLLGLLEQAIDKIYSFGNPDINLYDKNNTLQQFNIELIPQEIALLSDAMYSFYVSETKNKLNHFSTIFKSNELNVLFSPANERKSLLELINKEEDKINNAISNYLSRSRDTWEIKSIYDNGGSLS